MKLNHTDFGARSSELGAHREHGTAVVRWWQRGRGRARRGARRQTAFEERALVKRFFLCLPFFFFFYLDDCAHKSALLFGPITVHFLCHHPASFSSALLPKQCMNLSKGKMVYHLANEYFIVCKTMYSLPLTGPLFAPPPHPAAEGPPKL